MIKKFVFTLGIVLFTTFANAQIHNMDEAKTIAKKENRLILIKFSGSDWCGPCILLKKTIFDSSEFQSFANEKLVLLLADFPRQKKNQLPKEQQEWNNELAEKYNPQGDFPLLVLTDVSGSVLKTWDGYDKSHTVADYIKDIKSCIK